MPVVSRSSLIAVFFLAVFAVPAHALPVEDLYISEVLVTGESERQLKAGASAGIIRPPTLTALGTTSIRPRY